MIGRDPLTTPPPRAPALPCGCPLDAIAFDPPPPEGEEPAANAIAYCSRCTEEPAPPPTVARADAAVRATASRLVARARGMRTPPAGMLAQAVDALEVLLSEDRALRAEFAELAAENARLRAALSDRSR